MNSSDHPSDSNTTEPCHCHACVSGLTCADGERGVFAKESDVCQRCGIVALDHFIRIPMNWGGTQTKTGPGTP